jgi:hypothetical protein
VHRDRGPREREGLGREDPAVEGATGREGEDVVEAQVRVRVVLDRLEQGGEVVGRDVRVHHRDRRGDAGVAQRLDGHGHRLQLVPTARRTEVGDDDRFGAVDRGSGRPSRALQSRQTEAARRVLGERVSAVDAVAHHLAGQVECLGHAPMWPRPAGDVRLMLRAR